MNSSHPHLEVVIAPLGTAGATLPNNAAGGLAYSVGTAIAFRIPSFLYYTAGLFVLPAFESRSFSLDAESNTYEFTSRYLSTTVGLSFAGRVNVGLAVNIPTSLTMASFVSNFPGQTLSLPLSVANVILEPRVAFSIPLSPSGFSGNTLTIFAEGGYPLKPVLNADVHSALSSNLLNVRSIKLPHVQIGLSYVFTIFSTRPSGLL